MHSAVVFGQRAGSRRPQRARRLGAAAGPPLHALGQSESGDRSCPHLPRKVGQRQALASAVGTLIATGRWSCPPSGPADLQSNPARLQLGLHSDLQFKWSPHAGMGRPCGCRLSAALCSSPVSGEQRIHVGAGRSRCSGGPARVSLGSSRVPAARGCLAVGGSCFRTICSMPPARADAATLPGACCRRCHCAPAVGARALRSSLAA